MSTMTQGPAAFGTIERAAEPPWRRLAALAAGVLGTMGAIAAALALGAPDPATTTAWTGRVGPASLVVRATPLEAGPAPQKLTLSFARPRTGTGYEVLRSVAVRLTPIGAPAAPAAAPGGPPGPLRAEQVAPGTWEVTIPAAQAVTRPGQWLLRVSASLRPGQAFKRNALLTYG